jgi:hypothetical protein
MWEKWLASRNFKFSLPNGTPAHRICNPKQNALNIVVGVVGYPMDLALKDSTGIFDNRAMNRKNIFPTDSSHPWAIKLQLQSAIAINNSNRIKPWQKFAR